MVNKLGNDCGKLACTSETVVFSRTPDTHRAYLEAQNCLQHLQQPSEVYCRIFGES